jgi:RNA-binding protein PNO1
LIALSFLLDLEPNYCNLSTSSIKMVVSLSTTQTSQQAITHKKNRRKIHRKNGATPGTSKATADPSSSAHNGSDNDEVEMNDITETADLPEGFSSTLFPTPQASSSNADDDDELMIDADPSAPTDAPLFPPASASAQKTLLRSETRRVPIPPHRMTPLKKEWVNIFGPLTEILGLQVRMNVQRRCIEIRVRAIFFCRF